ncbi:MAG: fructose-bisphosphatase, class II [Candidatus Kerfeldbacteria bacterium RIFCSPLOWO2_01_FULL_48_11]|uniref:Fructose-1,6-bisphosphatase n=1 Tax=Candidatus Kerfeldbacteria bacterium RIFCSPLOWO2_01_FULL_48_11 TaxID=1798543 RepID=A0A1G2B4M3_9BACT|nr:MAG: Fructose-1,6-bisphosphatase [Parcubacteria group bacterium GW2011_GWA2_48_9]KKW15189.1 MAG: Fructose-1,6-bisphosphatase [Parcubacteria group bacterium GW2011_GWC2_49_9]OGY83666.1 MAG: fructose-bisphosphatase, class II [Candidatus Kerfeldbacteria bacterium RIFCSPLOWO2_01_FULL_48_11]
MDRNIGLEFVRVTEAAAIAASEHIGSGDKKEADRAATEAMRREFNFVGISGTVVIGEGERDEAPMLYIGEKVGSGGLELDIAVDPLECTNSVADGGSNSLAVIAAGRTGKLLKAPDTYMWKLAVGPRAANAIDLTKPVADNLNNIAAALGKTIDRLVVVILRRDRHKELVEEVRATGARIHFIEDGDVAGAIATALPDSPVDVLYNIGAAPEGVLAAAALRCMGGAIQAKFVWKDEAQIQRAKSMGITDPDKIYTTDELAGGDVIFAATGITAGDLLQGVRAERQFTMTHSIIGRSKSGTVRLMETRHNFGKHNS